MGTPDLGDTARYVETAWEKGGGRGERASADTTDIQVVRFVEPPERLSGSVRTA